MARVPLYKQAETELLRRITSGKWPVGMRIAPNGPRAPSDPPLPPPRFPRRRSPRMTTAHDCCRLCGSAPLEPLFDLGDQPISAVFPAPGQPDPSSSPLELVRCSGRGETACR